MVGGLGRFFPRDHAEAITRITASTDTSASRAQSLIDLWRQTRLNADGSPLTIQGSLSFFADPFGSGQMLIGAVRRGEFDELFSEEGMIKAILDDPAGWMDFSAHTNIPVTAGTAPEFSTGLLSRMRIPGVGPTLGQVNDSMFRAVLQNMKRQFDDISGDLVRAGADPEEAKQTAAFVVQRIVPMTNVRRAGIAPRRAATERALATSVSFIRQPLSFMGTAMRAYAKLGTRALSGLEVERWGALTSEERVAAKSFAIMNGSIAAISVASAVRSAASRELTMEEALERAIDPRSGDFYRLFIPGTDLSVPLGGPYRAMIRAMAPTRDLPVPFAGVTSTLLNRLTPALGTGLAILQNKDFYDEEIVSGDFPLNVVDMLVFLTEQALPISAASPLEARRRGLTPEEGATNTLSQFFGQNVADISIFERQERERRRGANTLLSEEVRVGFTDQQARAASEVSTLAELREAIGTRAANSAAEAANPGFDAASQRYIEDLNRRAERGDPIARSLLVSVDTQQRLTAAFEEGLNREDYRQRRGTIMAEQRGKQEWAAEELDRLRESDNEIDRDTARYFDLFDRAKRADGTIDFELFNTLEDSLTEELGLDRFSLVEANALTPPRGANVFETELREVRTALNESKYFDIPEGAWAEIQAKIKGNPKSSEDALALAAHDSFGDAMDAIVAELEPQAKAKLLEQGWSEELAEQLAYSLAENLSGSHGLVAAYNETVRVRKAEWAGEPENAELAAQAIQWGYLSNSMLNIGVTGEAVTELQRMTDVFLAGDSFGAIAESFDKSPEAVEQAMRREARRQGFANATEMREAQEETR